MRLPDGEVSVRHPSRLVTTGQQISPAARRALARLVAVHGVAGAAHRLRVGESTIEIVDGGGPVRRDTAERLQAALLADRCGCLGCALSLSVDAARAKNANLGGANLAGANLAGANLAGANLDGAYLDGAYLDHCDWERGPDGYARRKGE